MTHGSLVLLPTPTPACPAGVLLPPGCAPRRGPARWRGARDGPRLSAVTVRIAQSEIASAGHRPQKSRRALRAPARRKRAPGGRAARLESPEAGESPSRVGGAAGAFRARRAGAGGDRAGSGRGWPSPRRRAPRGPAPPPQPGAILAKVKSQAGGASAPRVRCSRLLCPGAEKCARGRTRSDY
ncbi:translation initiation factor IF-2-like isoform X1 [Cervus elaphus]|uniref:translation initiation factor IF-2-like isoform X1 n=1 Tax=Cervus elaphus TaxID=9860 RepID=UPI001CC2FA83|nr:translation initiation factor IF-2-like isoform X1 [Cervus elaphus]